MITEAIRENITEIVSIVEDAEIYNKKQKSTSFDTYLWKLMSKLMLLTDGAVTFAFEKNNSNHRLGAYRITLVCDSDVEDFINENRVKS